MKTIGLILFAAILTFAHGCAGEPRESIEASVTETLERYPSSTLKDLYKSYFQDYFGPGHLIHDTAAARNYMQYELNQDDYQDTLLLEPTGYLGNFYRVNLVLLKDGTIPVDTFFRYFIESVNSVEGITIEHWREEWKVIFEVIDGMDLDLHGFEADRKMIDSLLSTGEYVVHHSKPYLEAYHPHYRIIHRDVFEKHLRKYLE